ncbi:MAG TPA: hypothetical protein DEV72_00530, partial [Ktedonobacter sp.]|nr:hypothetical protein [Ktedonobacter sp.]
MSTNSQRLGKYELLERLGQGGMAEVWKARDTLLQRYVAIKILHANLQEDPNFITRFEREAQLIASLHHPNIVQIHDFQITRIPESTTPIAYMVMDYIEGGTLDEYIASTSARGKIPSPTQIVHLFTSMSLAIDYAHQQGMIHRDIKPANILLDKNNTTRNPMGEPILTDFGVAKLLGVTSSTLSASQLGTPLYVSPEQVRGYPGNERSDIYALGVILYEMVTGVPPFRGDTPVNVFTQHLNVTPTSPALINPSLPTALTLVILKALAKDPNERFASAASMTAAIAEALNMPVPESLGQAAYSQDEANMPTYLHSPWQLGTAPLPPSSTSGVDVINRAALHATPSAPSGGAQVYQVATTRDGTAKTGDPQATPLPAMHSPSPPPSQQRRRWRTLYGVVAALIIIAVLGSAVLVYFLKYTTAQVSPAL